MVPKNSNVSRHVEGNTDDFFGVKLGGVLGLRFALGEVDDD